MGKTETIHYVQAIKKHRFSVYVKCYDKHIGDVIDVLVDNNYQVSGVEVNHFNDIYEAYERHKSTGVHVIAFMPFDDTERIHKLIKTVQ